MAKLDFQEVLASPVKTYAEGLKFFRGRGMVNKALSRLAKDLDKHNIAYSVIGAVALNQHGYKRFTEDIDLLLSPEGLEHFQKEMVGLGYVPALSGASKKFRTTRENVPVKIITEGEYPGGGKPKPVQFHHPEEHSVLIDGIRTVTLEKLIELKLASGMTAPDRLRGLADVQELIKIHSLDSRFAERLDPYVRDKYLELHSAVVQAGEREE